MNTEQVRAAHDRSNWLTPAEFGERFGGTTAEYVRTELIGKGRIRALNLHADDPRRRAEYRIHIDELRRLEAQSTVNGHLTAGHGGESAA